MNSQFQIDFGADAISRIRLVFGREEINKGWYASPEAEI
jgi:hypothetical protein